MFIDRVSRLIPRSLERGVHTCLAQSFRDRRSYKHTAPPEQSLIIVLNGERQLLSPLLR